MTRTEDVCAGPFLYNVCPGRGNLLAWRFFAQVCPQGVAQMVWPSRNGNRRHNTRPPSSPSASHPDETKTLCRQMDRGGGGRAAAWQVGTPKQIALLGNGIVALPGTSSRVCFDRPLGPSASLGARRGSAPIPVVLDQDTHGAGLVLVLYQGWRRRGGYGMSGAVRKASTPWAATGLSPGTQHVCHGGGGGGGQW